MYLDNCTLNLYVCVCVSATWNSDCKSQCVGLARSRGNSTSIAFSGKIYTYTDFINILYSFISNIFFLCLTYWMSFFAVKF